MNPVYAWLKAERLHLTAQKRRERQEGVDEHTLAQRRLGKPEATRSSNRAARRAVRKLIKIK